MIIHKLFILNNCVRPGARGRRWHTSGRVCMCSPPKHSHHRPVQITADIFSRIGRDPAEHKMQRM